MERAQRGRSRPSLEQQRECRRRFANGMEIDAEHQPALRTNIQQNVNQEPFLKILWVKVKNRYMHTINSDF